VCLEVLTAMKSFILTILWAGNWCQNLMNMDLECQQLSHNIHLHTYYQLGSSVSIVTELWTRQPRFDSWLEQGSFLFATVSRLALGPTQSHMQRVSWIWELGVWGKKLATHIPLILRLTAVPPFPHTSS